MSEFIVWDKEYKYFTKEYTLASDGEICYSGRCIQESPILSIHNYIGIKDINDNNIYADSSIVEFVDLARNKLVGYFRFNKYALRYYIEVIRGDDWRTFRTSNFNDFDFKIIDTIQESECRT